MPLSLLALLVSVVNSLFGAQITPSFSTPPYHMVIIGTVPEEEIAHFTLNLTTQENGVLPCALQSDVSEMRPFHIERSAWIRFFSKKLLEERIQDRLGKSVACHFYPGSSLAPLSACVMVSESAGMEPLQASLWELKNLNLFGITEWELLQAKEETWYTLMCNGTASPGTAATIHTISSKDIVNYFQPLLDTTLEELDLSAPLEEPSDYSTISLLRCSQMEDETTPFYSLALSHEDKKNIYDVMHTIAKNNVVKLGLNKKSIKKKGEKFEHVHPLRFLSYVMGEGGMRGDFRKIRSSGFKWNGFMDGFSKRLTLEANQNNLLKYIPGFAHSLGIDGQKIRALIERRDWEGLITYFL